MQSLSKARLRLHIVGYAGQEISQNTMLLGQLLVIMFLFNQCVRLKVIAYKPRKQNIMSFRQSCTSRMLGLMKVSKSTRGGCWLLFCTASWHITSSF